MGGDKRGGYDGIDVPLGLNSRPSRVANMRGRCVIITRRAIMLKKRDLPLLVLIAVLFIMGAAVPIKRAIDRHSPMVTVCRNALIPGDSPSQGDLSYDYIDFSAGDYATVYFGYRGDTAFCRVHRNGPEWEVDGAGFFGISSDP